MKCQRCNTKEASLHYKTMINGQVAEYHLCMDCARALGYESNLQSFPYDPFGVMLGDFFSPWRSAPKTKIVTCPFCGATQKTIADAGKAGCAQCYATFPGLFDPLIRRIHGEASHCGKIPSTAGAELRSRKELERLKTELKEAVNRQDYEQAATLRDRIKELESGGNAP
jgi:protein arginine kinase activator